MTRWTNWDDISAPSEAEIELLARDAIALLPSAFSGPANQVSIRVAEFASDEILAEVDIDDPFELTGLYDGIPMTEKSSMDQVENPDTIWLFRRPIIDEWAARGDVTMGALVAHVITHELAHHFGWSDEDIAKIDRWWE